MGDKKTSPLGKSLEGLGKAITNFIGKYAKMLKIIGVTGGVIAVVSAALAAASAYYHRFEIAARKAGEAAAEANKAFSTVQGKY